MRKIFEVHQKLTAFTNKYNVLADYDGVPKTIAFVRQKPLAMREQILIYSDDSRQHKIGLIKANKVMELAATYNVYDENDQFLGAIKKEFKRSLVSSSWTIYKDQAMDKPVCSVREKDNNIAILRRLWGFIPWVGELPFPIKYHFLITDGESIVGEYNKITLFRDRYELLLTDAASQSFDNRVWIGLSILLDALESR